MGLYLKKKKKTKKKFFKPLFFLLTFILSLSLIFNYIVDKNINFENENILNLIFYNLGIKTKKIKRKKSIKVSNLLNLDYVNKNTIKETTKKDNIDNYLVYIYNTHQSEEYNAADLIDNSIVPTVSINDYIIKKKLEDYGINTIVEERSIKDLRYLNNYDYSESYKASRIYIEDIKKNYPSIKYFIDIHRDSLKKERTTIDISGKSYASILFLIGLENKNWQKNYDFSNLLSTKINEKYPNLSKGILKKGGAGVNGVYNQDNNEYTILIEIGGEENTVMEVMNSALAISDILCEVIESEE